MIAKDDQFVAAFEANALPGFHHRDHIRLAWCYLSKFGLQKGSERIESGIKRFAELNNAGSLYHRTITMFWIYGVNDAMEEYPSNSFEEFIKQKPQLLDKNHIYEFYSKALLSTTAAKRGWVEPDFITSSSLSHR